MSYSPIAPADTATKLYATTDAQVWARSFVEIVMKDVTKLDEGFMIGWFANAIETAKDHQRRNHASNFEELCRVIHQGNVDAGWWTDLATGERKNRNVGELLMLVVSEIAEGMEGHRKSLQDDKLPHRPMLEVELADAIIRIADIAGGLGLDVAGAIVEKRAYNATREDHKIESRKAATGKKY